MLTGMGRALAVFLAALVGLGVAELAAAEERSTTVRLPRTGTESTEVTVVVARGDHLWKISERYLEELKGEEPSNSEISPYWRLVIETNRDRLRSGDPDLIYPGERITLPNP